MTLKKFTTALFIFLMASDFSFAQLNEWNGNINPQLIMEDYDIVKEEKNILNAWGF